MVFSNPHRLDRNSLGGRIMVYERNINSSNLVRLDQIFENFESLFIKLELS